MTESDQDSKPAATSEQAPTAGNSPGKEPPNIILGIQSALRYQLANGPPPTTVTVPSYPSFLSLPPPPTQTGVSSNGTRFLSSMSTQGEGAASPARLSSSGANGATPWCPTASRSFRHMSLDGPRLRQSASGASPNTLSPASPFSSLKPQTADGSAPPAPQQQHHVASVSSMITDMLYGMAQRRRDSLKYDTTTSSIDGGSSTAAGSWGTAGTSGGMDPPRGSGCGGGGAEQGSVARARLQRSSTLCPAVGGYGSSSPSRTAVSYKYDMSGYDAARHAMMKQQSYGDAGKPPAGSDRPGTSGYAPGTTQSSLQGSTAAAGSNPAGSGGPSVRFAGLGLGRADRSVSTNGGGGGGISGGARSSISGRRSTPGQGSPASPPAGSSHLGMRGSLSGAGMRGSSGAGGARVSVDGGMLGEGANTQQRPRTSAVLQAMRSSKQLSPPGTIWPPPSPMQHAVRQHAYGSCPGPLHQQDSDTDRSIDPASPAVPAPHHSPASSRSRVRISIPDTADITQPGVDSPAAGEPGGAFGDRLGHLQLQCVPQQPTVITARAGISNGRFQMSKRWSAITMAMAAAAAVEGAAAGDGGSPPLPAAPSSPVLSPDRPNPTAANHPLTDPQSSGSDELPTSPAPHPDPTAPPPQQPAPTAFPCRPATPPNGPALDALRPRLASSPPPQQPPACGSPARGSPTRGSRNLSSPEACQQVPTRGSRTLSTPEAGQEPVYYGTPGLRILVGWSGGPGGSPVLPGGGASAADSCDPVVRSRTSSRASSRSSSRASTPSGRASSRMGHQLLVASRSGPSFKSGPSLTGLSVGFVGAAPTGAGTAAAAAASGTDTGGGKATAALGEEAGGVGVTGLGGQVQVDLPGTLQMGVQQQEEVLQLQEVDGAGDEDGGAEEGAGGGGGGPGVSFYEQLQQLQAMAVAAAERERERARCQGHGAAAWGRGGCDGGTAGGAAGVAGVIRTILGRDSMVAAQRVAVTGSHLRTGRHQQVGASVRHESGCGPSTQGQHGGSGPPRQTRPTQTLIHP